VKDLIVRIIKDEVWLGCPDHGLIRHFGTYANLSDIVAAEHEHATVHLYEVHDLTDA
jgi:hypothetical protein